MPTAPPPSGGGPPLGEVLNHNRQPLPRGLDFFVAPPPEIGLLLSAFSTLRRGRKPWPIGARVGLLVGAIVSGVLSAVFFAFGRQGVLAVLAAVLTLVAALVVWLVTRFNHRCTYVGQLGAARFTCHGGRRNVRGRVFLFAEATELRTAQTRHYYNGAYTGTDYRFTWTDFHGGRVFHLGGRYHNAAGNPKAKDPFHFAMATELAWSLYLLTQAPRQLADGGSIRFGLRGADSLRLGSGYIALNRKGETITLRGDEIARIRIQHGIVSILEPGAKEGWFSSSGVYKFAYSELANAQFFLILMDHLFGVRPNA
jgi:hypothetical protein